MTTETRYAHSPDEVAAMDTAQLRDAFVADGLFVPGEARGAYLHHDRILVFGIVPTRDPIELPNPDEVRAQHLLQRREAGILNVGALGVVVADGREFIVAHAEAVYLGRGADGVSFRSLDPADPAAFYVFSAVAHTSLPHALITREDMNIIDIGSPAASNERTLHQCIIEGRTPSANIAFLTRPPFSAAGVVHNSPVGEHMEHDAPAHARPSNRVLPLL